MDEANREQLLVQTKDELDLFMIEYNGNLPPLKKKEHENRSRGPVGTV